jgi:hypothetical protein
MNMKDGKWKGLNLLKNKKHIILQHIFHVHRKYSYIIVVHN